ncbi:hypothetical protein Dsin_022027 [Dipteronia sinensis]|uniref:CCHC-type domain-containing protein n=1 Tax=Dipteronia sinensis TaxID=43782 RepID=A0AAE0E0S3_9ROSI|nr:hypothetical protein Dsin_022027 [Dipteronia sinensis]
MCMDRRTTKWMAEQIGCVVDIPTESKECWGKFMKVEVQVDISKPSKRWLRLKLDKSETIVMVGLKYERLPEFCYACRRIGHGIKECPDDEARVEALKEVSTKFGPWVKALVFDRMQVRHLIQRDGNSNVQVRSQEGTCDVSEDDPYNLRFGVLVSHKGDLTTSGLVSRKTKNVSHLKPLIIFNRPGSPQVHDRRLESPTEVPKIDNIAQAVVDEMAHNGPILNTKEFLKVEPGHINARIHMEHRFLWRFSGFYGDPIPSKRVNSWAILYRLRDVDNLPWVCGWVGRDENFNELLCLNEKECGSDKSISSMIRFRQAIDDCDLIGLGSSGPKLT